MIRTRDGKRGKREEGVLVVFGFLDRCDLIFLLRLLLLFSSFFLFLLLTTSTGTVYDGLQI